MRRRVEPELLDALSPAEPAAVHSRRDLRRINAMMGNHRIMGDAFRANFSGGPENITELGAGDGEFFLEVARQMAPCRPGNTVTLLDRQKTVSGATLAAFSRLGWRAEAVVADVFDRPEIPGGIVAANLFLHHFENDWLAGLLGLVAKRARLFVAVEPRRAAWPWFCSRLLGAVGCNYVTRHDAPVSVRAGFTGAELSALWPDPEGWQLAEGPAGAFSHLFIARRKT